MKFKVWENLLLYEKRGVTEESLGDKGMWLAREPGAGSGERGAGIKRAGSRDCRKKSRNR
jgi:hypothetical protein